MNDAGKRSHIQGLVQAKLYMKSKTEAELVVINDVMVQVICNTHLFVAQYTRITKAHSIGQEAGGNDI